MVPGQSLRAEKSCWEQRSARGLGLMHGMDGSPLGLPCCPSILVRTSALPIGYRPTVLHGAIHCTTAETLCVSLNTFHLPGSRTCNGSPCLQSSHRLSLSFKACHSGAHPSLLLSSHCPLLLRGFSLTSRCAPSRCLHPKKDVLILQESDQMLPSFHSLLRFF